MTIWLISDTHFSHENCITKFKRADGSPLRDFHNVHEMDEHLVEQWNKHVKPADHVWHLGDVVVNRKHLGIVRRLNGHKRLIPGNHDIFDVKEYLAVGFEKVQGYRVFGRKGNLNPHAEGKLICSHIPLHPSALGRFGANAHGHIHHNPAPDGPYVNLSVEMTEYRPVALEEIEGMLK